MSLQLQAKLLRVLGAGGPPRRRRQPRRVDVRVVAATNKDLDEMLAAGQVSRGPLLPPQRHHPIVVPPLRERAEDIPLLAEHFLAQLRASRRRSGSRPRRSSELSALPLAGQRPRAAQRRRRLMICMCASAPSH